MTKISKVNIDGVDKVLLVDNKAVHIPHDPVSGNKALTPTTSEQTNIDVADYATASVAAITKELLASLDADFVAENIKKDVDLFGLLGTLEGGGGGMQVKTGSFTLVDTVACPYTVSHGLEKIPSIIAYYPLTTFGPTDSHEICRAIAGIGTPTHQFGVYYNTSATYGRGFIVSQDVDWTNRAGNGPGVIAKVTSNTFDMYGRSDASRLMAWTYKWIAIG